jgi:hypothetical protein
MQGKTEADVAFLDMPMQSPYSGGGNVLQPTSTLLNKLPFSQIQLPFEIVPPRAMTSGSCSSTKDKLHILGLNFHKISFIAPVL